MTRLARLHSVLAQLAAARREELPGLKARGVPIVGYFCNYVPRELILAAGAIPIRLAEGGDYGSRVKGERYVRADACPFCKSCVARFADDPLYKLVSVLVAPSTCDQMRRLPEVIHKHFGLPVWQLALPRTIGSDSARALFRDEVARLGGDLEHLTGRTVTAEALARAMLEEEEKRALLRAINETRQADAPPVSESDILELVRVTNLLRGPDCAALLRHGLIELGVRPAGVGSRPRLLLAGSIVAGEDRDLVRAIEERADIVADLICTGVRSFLHRLEVPVTQERGELLAVLADYYFDQPGCIHRRPNTGYYELARALIRSCRVQGIIYKTLLFCDAYALEAVRLERELGLPFLHLDTDYGEGNQQQVLTRIEAFLETLHYAAPKRNG